MLKLIDLLPVISEKECVFIRANLPINYSNVLKELDSATISLKDATVKNIEMNGTSMLFIDIDIKDVKGIPFETFDDV